MKSQFHYDYPRVMLAAFFALVGYAAKTIVGYWMAVVLFCWMAFVIACNVVRAAKVLWKACRKKH